MERVAQVAEHQLALLLQFNIYKKKSRYHNNGITNSNFQIAWARLLGYLTTTLRDHLPAHLTM